MLSRHILRLGGEPSGKTGAFHDRIMALEPHPERVDLMNRGQGWVIRRIREILPRSGDDELHKELMDMLDVHERSIRRRPEPT